MFPSEKYNELEPDRKQYETRAEEISNLTLPYIMRPEGSSGSTTMRHTLSQSFNGMLINNLKSKIGMAILPPSTSSFRFKPDAKAMVKLFGENSQQAELLNKELSMNTDVINGEIENQQIRSDLFDMIVHLIVVGAVVVEKIEGKGIQIIPLRNFVAELDNKGNPYTIVIKETVVMLPEGITVANEKDSYDIFTMATIDEDTRKWIVTQDIDGEAIGEEKTYNDEDLPFKYLGWTWNVGDKYHRPFAEDYKDDMEQVNNLSRLNTNGALVAAKVLLFVDQKGNRTKKRDVANSANGDVVDGRADDVTALQLSKNYDFQASNAREMEIKKTLQKAFLDTGSITRDAERVTAQEIRLMAQQLEASTLAGIYSKMSLQFQKWLVHLIMNELGIKFKAIDVDILTGLDALGRTQESQKLDGFIQRMATLQQMEYINMSELITRYASFEGINTTNLIKSEQEVTQARQAAQQAQQKQMMMEEGAKSAGQSGGKAMIEGAPQQ